MSHARSPRVTTVTGTILGTHNGWNNSDNASNVTINDNDHNPHLRTSLFSRPLKRTTEGSVKAGNGGHGDGIWSGLVAQGQHAPFYVHYTKLIRHQWPNSKLDKIHIQNRGKIQQIMSSTTTSLLLNRSTSPITFTPTFQLRT